MLFVFQLSAELYCFHWLYQKITSLALPESFNNLCGNKALIVKDVRKNIVLCWHAYQYFIILSHHMDEDVNVCFQNEHK